MARRAKREDAFLGPALLLVAACTAEGGIELMEIKRLLQRVGLHDLSVQRGTGRNRIDTAGKAVLVHMHNQVEPEALRCLVTKRDHVAEFPGCIDM